MNMKNKVVLITGSGNRIGKATAKKFTNLGATVIIVGRREEKLISTVNEIGENLSYIADDILK